jgi:hypothetical protein
MKPCRRGGAAPHPRRGRPRRSGRCCRPGRARWGGTARTPCSRPGTGAVRHRHPVARRDRGLVVCRYTCPHPPLARSTARAAKADEPPLSTSSTTSARRSAAPRPSPTDHQVHRRCGSPAADVRLRGDGGQQRPLDLAARQVVGADDAAARVPPLAPQREVVALAVKRTPSSISSLNPRRPLADQHLHGVAVAEPGAGHQRVLACRSGSRPCRRPPRSRPVHSWCWTPGAPSW